MALMIVISTGDFQIHWNVLYCHCGSVKEKVENGLLGQVVFIIIISNDCIQHSGKYPFATPNLNKGHLYKHVAEGPGLWSALQINSRYRQSLPSKVS